MQPATTEKRFAWVLVQLTWTVPKTYVSNFIAASQFTQNLRYAKKFKDRRDAEDWVREYAFAWPHKPIAEAAELPPPD